MSNYTRYRHKVSGDVATKTVTTTPGSWYIVDGSIRSYSLPSHIVEKSNDWELEVSTPPTKTQRLGPNGQYAVDSTGVIYGLRDIVMSLKFPGTEEGYPILSFIEEYLEYNNTIIITAQVNIERINIDALQKVVVTTTDGANVFNASSMLYILSPFNFKLYEDIAGNTHKYPSYLVFSSKEARFDYVVQHKPVITLAELKGFNVSATTSISIKNYIKEKLRKNGITI